MQTCLSVPRSPQRKRGLPVASCTVGGTECSSACVGSFEGGHHYFWASLVAQTVKRLSAMQETWVQSLGWEEPLKKEMAAHSSILTWKIPWMEEPGGLQSMGSQRVGHN